MSNDDPLLLANTSNWVYKTEPISFSFYSELNDTFPSSIWNGEEFIDPPGTPSGFYTEVIEPQGDGSPGVFISNAQGDLIKYFLGVAGTYEGVSSDYRVSFSDILPEVTFELKETWDEAEIFISNGSLNPSDVEAIAFRHAQPSTSNITSANVFFDTSSSHLYVTSTGLSLGEQGAHVVLHELAHVLGLKHVSTAGYTDLYATQKYTIMTDFSGGNGINSYVHPDLEISTGVASAWATGLQLYDIAALQSIYGRNYDVRGIGSPIANTIYNDGQGFNADVDTPFIYTIWDGGGIDKIDASGYEVAAQIDIRQGHFSSIGVKVSGGGAIAFDDSGVDHGNVAIAYHAVIENAKGTNYADILIGNRWANVLEGGAGSDELYGEGFVYDGDDGFTTVDTFDSKDPNQWKPGVASDNDTLDGGTGADQAFGGYGDDRFIAAHDGSGSLQFDLYHGGGYTLVDYRTDGFDTVDYSGVIFGDDSGILLSLSAAANATANVYKWNATSGATGTENSLISIEGIIGTHFDDYFSLLKADRFKIDGGNGQDTIDFAGYSGSVLINLHAGTVQAAAAGQWQPATFKVSYIENAVGTARADTIVGSNEANVLVGGTADDTMTGKEGADVFSFAIGDDDDVITDYDYSRGDQLRFTANVHGVVKSGDLEFSRPSTTNDLLITYHGNSILLKDFYNSVITGHAVAIEFATGVKTFSFLPSGPVMNPDDGNVYPGGGGGGPVGVTLTGTSGGEVLAGTDHNDKLYGLGGDDYLIGYAGNDTLSGGDGDDLLLGGNGNDVLNGDNGNNRVWGGSGIDYLSAYGDGDNWLSGGADGDIIAVYNFSATNIAFGDGGDDVLNSYNFSSGTGSNILYGGEGSDELYVENGVHDTLDGGEGNDTLENEGDSGANTLIGGNGNDIVYANGSDIVEDGEGEDIYYAGYDSTEVIIYAAPDGDDDSYVQEAAGTGTLSYERGTNGIFVGGSGDVSSDAFGDDSVSGAPFRLLVGTSGNDTFEGGYGQAVTFAGGAGRDYFDTGSTGRHVIGGADGDTFLRNRGTGMKILDYNFNEGDLLYWEGDPTATVSDLVGERIGDDLYLNLNIPPYTGGIFILANFYLSPSSYILIEQEESGEGAVVISADSSAVLTFPANYGTHADDTQTGDSGNNYISGGAGHDSQSGGDGDDTLDGGADADFMAGGDDNDVYIVDDSGDVVFEEEDEGTDTVESSVSYELPDNVENLTLTGDMPIDGLGNELDNVITGNEASNTLSGGEGSDTYIFGEGSGHDVVDDFDGTDDAIEFDATVDPNSVFYNRSGDDLVIGYGTQGDTVTIRDYYTSGDTVEKVVFSDTTIHDAEHIAEHLEIIAGTSGDDTFDGTTGNDVLAGLGGEDTLDGLDGDDTIDGGAGDDVLAGGAGDDTFAFADGSGADIVSDSDGTLDSIVFAAGVTASSVIYTQVGDDLLIKYGTQGDTVTVTDYFVSMDTIEEVVFADATMHDGTYIAAHLEQTTAGSGNDVLSGTIGNDTLSGLAGDDTLTGFAGDDTLDGGSDEDVMTGGLGDDTYIVDNAADVVNENGNQGTDTVLSSAANFTLGANVENLTLSGSGNIDAAGNSIDNIITGNSGNNTLNGGVGADTLVGGGGNDTFVVDNAGDSITAGAGTDTVSSSIGYSLSTHANVENIVLTGSANINATGNSLANIITGNTGVNTLAGDTGNDTISGGSGSDVYVVNDGDGTDIITDSAGTLDIISFGASVTSASADYARVGDDLVITYGTGVDNITVSGFFTSDSIEEIHFDDSTIHDGAYIQDIVSTGTSGDDILIGTSGADTLSGLNGNDTVSGLGSVDILDGGDGSDTLDGGAGNDTLTGGDGNDAFIVDSASDVVSEGSGGSSGTDTVYSTATSYTLATNVEHLVLSGSANINGIGNGTNNSLTGNGGNNTLDGGAGDDTMAGGAGNDVYVIDSLSDVITEGSGAGSDTIQTSLSGYTLAISNVENLTLLGSGNIDATGDDDDNIITGNSGANTLYGMDGNDTLDGGAGADRMDGSDGDNVFYVDNANDKVYTRAGYDTIYTSVTWTPGGLGNGNNGIGVEVIILTGSANINAATFISDTPFADDDVTIVGNSGTNTLTGSGGDDTFYVGTGDVAVGNGGLDNVISDVSFTLSSTTEILTLTGAGNINGTGSSNNNTLIGNAGTNTLTGGAGNDTYFVSTGDSVVELSSEGTDTVNSDVTFTLSSNVENLTLTGSGNIDATGNSADNTLTGNSGANVLTGGAGNDTYVVSTGDSIVESASAGTDTVCSDISWTLATDFENVTLIGTAAIDATGNSVANTLTGNSGVNTLTGGSGNDVYIVSTGDVVVESSSGGTDSVQSDATFTLSSDVENLTLTGSANINGTGNTSGNTITGNTGNNTLDGGSGSDSLIGGAGDDTYVLDTTLDGMTEGASAGLDTVMIGATYTLAANFENLVLTGTGNINGTGNTASNTLVGNSGINTLSGSTGNDTYIISTGDEVVDTGGIDTVQTDITYILDTDFEHLILTGSANIDGTGHDSANNSLTGNSGNNTLDGKGGVDVMAGGDGDDVYIANLGTDVVVELASGGTDTVRAAANYTLSQYVENIIMTSTGAGTGNSGDNTLDGSQSANVNSLVGGDGNDTFIVGTADVALENANEGIDSVYSAVTFTITDVDVENLTLTGSGNVNATGNASNNTITGNSGNNSLNGNGGSDTLIGGTGDDTYVVTSTSDDIRENASSGTDTVSSSITFSIASISHVENLILTGTTVNGTGNTLDNVITGSSSVNTLDGGDGNDTLDGAAGIDVLIGGNGDDYYIVTSASETVTEGSSAGNDTIQSSVTLSISALANIENIVLTSTGNATGNSGNNTLDGSQSANVNSLIGGTGDDIYIVGSSDIVVENSGEGTDNVYATVSYTITDVDVENLILRSGAGAINGTGNASNNTIAGNESNNVLIGGGGSDTLAGGTGDDTYTVTSTSDTIVENSAEGADTVSSSVTFSLASISYVENLTLTGTTVNGTGNSLDNTITGSSSVNTLDGGDGNDVLNGGNGNDTLIGGNGNDELNGGLNNDSMSGGDGDDLYIVDSASDTVNESGTGIDTVEAGIAFSLAALTNIENLVLTAAGTGTGNTLNNTLDGRIGGVNSLVGGSGDDVYFVGTSDVVVENASEGTDIVYAGLTYTITDADVENLTLTGTGNFNGTGNASANILVGNSGNNSLSGSGGNDILSGGDGTDTMTGGANADTFVFAVASYGDIDVVTDFTSGSGNDVLDIRDLLTGYDGNVTNWVRITDSGANSKVEVDRDGAGTTYGWTQIATLNSITGLTDEAALVSNGNLQVS